MKQEGETPVFVKVSNYKEVLDVFELLRDKLQQAKRTLEDINELRNEEDSELDLWRTTLDELEKKTNNINRVLFEPESTWWAILDEEKELFFAELRNPNEIRRNVLEARREIIESLQRYENIKFLRDQKLEKIKELRKVTKDINKTIVNLRNILPKAKIREETIQVKKKKETQKKRKVKKKEEPKEKHTSELDRMEAELNAIEEKLNLLK